MRKRFHDLAEKGRLQHSGRTTSYGDRFGDFMLTAPTGAVLRVIAHDGEETGWEHVSVSLADRTPTWEEMAWVKTIFWTDDEWVVEFHPAKTSYVNIHSHCLHLWMPTEMQLPVPPKGLV